MSKGILVVLEGPDGCGKSIQTDMLVKYLKQKDFDVIKTHEPGGTELGEMIRKYVLNPKINKDPYMEMIYFEAARGWLVSQVIKPNLDLGKIIVTDRWAYATEAYQGYGSGIDLKLIKQLNKSTTQGIEPDLTIFIDIPAEKGLEKVTEKINEGKSDFKEKDWIEKKGPEYHLRVAEGYREIARNNPKIKVIRYIEDGIDEMHQDILDCFNHYVLKHNIELKKEIKPLY